MRSWLERLLRSNRGAGPKPGGLCLWQSLDELEALSEQLAGFIEQGAPRDWQRPQHPLTKAEPPTR